MHKKLVLFSIISVFFIASLGTLALLLPSLCNLYLLPYLLRDLPFTVKEANLSRITPWTARGSLYLGNDDRPVVAVPRFQLSYSPRTLLNGKTSVLLIDAASLHIDLTKDHPADSGPPDQPAVADQAMTASALKLPFALEKLVVNNLVLTFHRNDQESFSLTTDSQFTLGYDNRGENGVVPETLVGEISGRGAVAFTAGLKGRPTPLGHELDFRLQTPDIGSIARGIPSLASLQPTGGLTLTGQILLVPPENSFSAKARITAEMAGPPLTIAAEGRWHADTTELRFQLDSEAFALGNNLAFDPVLVEGKMTLEGSTVTGELEARLDKIVARRAEMVFKGFELHLPFAFPQENAAETATLTVTEIHYRNINCGRLVATVTPERGKIAFKSEITSPLAPALHISCAGRTDEYPDFTLGCTLPATEIHSTSLAGLLQLPVDLSFAGELTAQGEMTIDNGTPRGWLRAGYHNGTLNVGEAALGQIDFGINLPHLPLLQSAPGQLCTIGTLDLGKVKATDAVIHFRIEDFDSLFLEKSRFSWCGGSVDTGGIRVTRTMEDVETTLYCDRLGFTELLGQFGIDDAEGEGSLNGRLPIVVSRKGIVFDDGFLFSTPGKSGIVRFHDSSQVAAGMGGIDQAAYLDYSLKALENFAYNWTKLTFSGDQEELLINMQLDGKPALPLPFGYRDGQIVKNTEGPGLQHPILLDVNVRLPTKDMFRFGKNVQSIMEKM